MKRAILVACFTLFAIPIQARDRPARPNTSEPTGGAGSNAALAAQARIRDAEAVLSLTAEGRALYAADATKRSAYEYCGMAITLAERGELRQAVRAAAKALFLGVNARNEDHIAHAKRDLAMTYLYAGDLTRAEQYATEALKHYKEPQNRNAVDGVAQKILGDVALRKDEHERAIRHYEAAIDRAEGDLRFYARAALAAAMIAAGDPKAAAAIDRAEAAVELVTPRQQASSRTAIGRLRGALSLKHGQAEQAVAYYQTAIAALGNAPALAYDRFWMLDGLSRAQQRAGNTEGALMSLLAAIGEIERVRARFFSEEFKTGLFGNAQDAFDRAVTLLLDRGKVEAAWEINERGRGRALLDLLRNRVKFAAGSTVLTEASGKAVTHTALANDLKAGEAIVSYRVMSDRTFAWVTRSNGVRAVRIDIGRRDLARRVEGFRDALIAERDSTASLGAALHDLLVRPLGLETNEALTILPHDALHYLPFQALRDGDGYLIQKHAVSYAPSASAVTAAPQKNIDRNGKLFALGNPDVGDPALALPGAQKEVEALSRLFPTAETYFRADATRERLLGGASQARHLHVAAHGTVDPVDPLHSRLLLAKQPDSTGIIEARDIYPLNLQNTALVTLSACESGLGSVSSGDEIWGFTRSFLAAGASSLLVSLWPVADDATEMLMTRFYESYAKGMARREALRSAELAVLADPRFRSPLFWAAFNLVGDSR